MERFNSNAVVDGATYSPLAAEILFCCLNGDVREEKLDLVEFTTCCVAAAGARPTKVMRTFSEEATKPPNSSGFLRNPSVRMVAGISARRYAVPGSASSWRLSLLRVERVSGTR